MTESLSNQLIELDQFIDAIPEDCDEKQYIEEFNAVMERIEEKIDSCVGYFDYANGRLHELKLKQDRVKEAIARYNKKILNMENYLKHCASLSEGKLTGKQSIISIRKNPPALKVDYKPIKQSFETILPEFIPIDLLPYAKMKVVYVIDKMRLKSDIKIKDGIVSAHLEQSTRLVIKDK